MAMDKDDERYFTQQFGLVHKRITESEKYQTNELNRLTLAQNKDLAEIKGAIDSHKIESATHNGAAVSAAAQAASLAIEKHEDESWVHNPVKTWTLAGAIAAVFATLGAALMWLFKHIKP